MSEWVFWGITVFQAKSLSPTNTEAWSCSLSRSRRGYYWAKIMFGKVFFDDKSGQHGWSTWMGLQISIVKANLSNMLSSPSNQGNYNPSRKQFIFTFKPKKADHGKSRGWVGLQVNSPRSNLWVKLKTDKAQRTNVCLVYSLWSRHNNITSLVVVSQDSTTVDTKLSLYIFQIFSIYLERAWQNLFGFGSRYSQKHKIKALWDVSFPISRLKLKLK